MRRRKMILFIAVIIIFSIFLLPSYGLAINQKALIIVLDELDLSIAEKIINDDVSLGLMSTKTAELYKESSKESFFMTMAAGRRLKLKMGLYEGIQRTDTDSIRILGYENVIKDFRHKYPSFSREISLLGDSLRKNGIRTGFLGRGHSSLLIADKDGKIDKGIDSISYNDKWLKEKTDELFRYVDVLVVSYEIDGQQERIKILKRYIDNFSSIHLYVFPENINGDISYRWNSTLVPLIYRSSGEGVGTLTSKTTRRDGLVANLDIKTDIEAKYDISKGTNIGNRLEVIRSKDIIEESKNDLLEFLNLNIIKYVFHGYVIIGQLYVLYNYVFMKKRNIHQYEFIMTSIILSIFLSLIYGVFNFHRHIVTYCIFIIITSLVISKILIERGINSINVISIITNILILIGVYFNLNMIYDSFIGYNNIVAAGRFYGLNNDIMGVLIVTSIITFYKLKGWLSNYVPSSLALLYFGVVIIALSGRHGANVGGYITSIILFLILIYSTLFGRNKDKKGMLFLIGIGIIIFGVNLYIDINSANTSHAGSLIERIKFFGFNELMYILTVKLKQLLIISILPPWSIIILFQILFLRRFYKDEKKFIKHITEIDIESFEKYCIMFIVSIIAFIINDTGAVAFSYINTYLIASLFNAYKLELLLDGDG
ncbi:hypothetical protein [Proteiniborus sp. MB09-C3]|uniref:hypothetical protein n=1 Tax=Proteiniborus sp. MB09-C3 TaxID=3050072 RepID=UPI002553F8F1|nr:hypothetical protein [Proteiniborus sp. MB09-C3]WIV11602.1 hypothetical protein QO263_16090 [Proteiniborus sp. MB09-C3]